MKISEVMTAFADELADIAPLRIGAWEAATSVAAPAWALIVERATTDQTRSPGAFVGRARAVRDDLWNMVIHAWGVDFAQAERLRQAAATAILRVAGPGNVNLGDTAVSEAGALGHGTVFSTRFQLRLPLLEATWSPTVGQQDRIADAVVQGVRAEPLVEAANEPEKP